jgi:hypothetical protein
LLDGPPAIRPGRNEKRDLLIGIQVREYQPQIGGRRVDKNRRRIPTVRSATFSLPSATPCRATWT